MKARLVACLVLASLTFGCGAPQVGVMPRYGSFDIDGDIGISASGNVQKNSTDALGLEDDDDLVGVDAYFKWGMPHLSVSMQQSSHDGSGRTEAPISEVGSPPIPAGTPVNTDLDLGVYSGALTFDLLPGDMWELGIGFGATYVDFDGSISDPGGGVTIDADESFPVPLLAARAGVELGRFAVTGLLSGVTLEVDGDDVTYLDLDLKGKYQLFGAGVKGDIVVGYRLLDFDLDYEDDGDEVEADLSFEGLYFGFEFSF